MPIANRSLGGVILGHMNDGIEKSGLMVGRPPQVFEYSREIRGER